MQLDYRQKDIDKLWNILSHHKTPYWSQPPGIRAVNFPQSFLEEFEERHRARAEEQWKGIETIVTTDLEHAIRLLSNARISHHRLSCVAHEGIGDNTAIYINYIDETDRKRYSLAIPGLNYIYPS